MRQLTYTETGSRRWCGGAGKALLFLPKSFHEASILLAFPAMFIIISFSSTNTFSSLLLHGGALESNAFIINRFQ